MDVSGELKSAPIATPSARLLAAFSDLDNVSKLALVCLVIAWFFVDTLVVRLGSLKHGVRFFDVSALIADPTRMFLGIDVTLQTLLFGLLCAVCLLVPLLPHLKAVRLAWLTYFAPLILLACCAFLLYSRTSAEFFNTPADPVTVSGKVIRFANSLVHRGGDLVARHVAIGFGGYLAALSSAVLAMQGMRRFHSHHRRVRNA
ncbi:MAG TPA: hypothetical protein VGI93_03370 [Steroidobacteraceae bacterium]|jgi:hypothetical protein